MKFHSARHFLRAALLVMLAAFACFASACSLREAAVNREKMQKLRVGMTKDQVRQIMGDPLEKEVYSKPDIWYYFTESRWFDGVNTRDECTPLVFDPTTGTLLGWGYDFYKEYLNNEPWMRRQLDQQL